MPIKKWLQKTGRANGFVLFFVFFLTLFSPKPSQATSKWALGLGTGWLSDYPGAGQGRFRFLPFPVYRGSMIRLDKISGVSGKVFNNSRVDFSWNFIFQFPTASSLIPVRQGMPDLNWMLSIGPQFKYFIYRSQFHSTYFRFPVRVNTCTNFSSQTEFCGLTFNPGLRHAMILPGYGGLTFRWELFSQSSEYQKYLYEVSPKYATPWRPAYHARAGFMGFVYGFFHSLPFEGWEISTSVNIYDYSLAVNQKSPLFVQKTSYAFFVAFVVNID